jgi:hypothetical protein
MGCDAATVDKVGVVAESAASESLPAQTPAAITAASTAPAAPTGTQRAASFWDRDPLALRELAEREPDEELGERLA